MKKISQRKDKFPSPARPTQRGFPQRDTADLVKQIQGLIHGPVGVIELAALLGVSRQYIHQLIQQGRLPYTRVDRTAIICPEDLEAWGQNPNCKNPVPRLFSLREAAMQLGIATETLRHGIKTHGYPHHRINQRQIFLFQDGLDYIRSLYNKERPWLGNYQRRILAVLQETAGPLSWSEIRDQGGISRSGMGRGFYSLVRRGIVVREASGKYRLSAAQ